MSEMTVAEILEAYNVLEDARVRCDECDEKARWIELSPSYEGWQRTGAWCEDHYEGDE